MAVRFDPYREWLGIDGGQRAADYYRVFALPPFTADPQLIDAAAQLAIDRVRQLSAGPHADVQRQLVEQLLRARRCLLDPAAKARYDERLRGGATKRDEPASAAVAAPPPEPADADSAEALWDDVARVPHRLRSAPRRKRSSGLLAATLILGSLIGAFGGLAYWQSRSGQSAEPQLAVAPQPAPVAPPSATSPPTEPRLPVAETPPVQASEAVAQAAPVTPAKIRPASAPKAAAEPAAQAASSPPRGSAAAPADGDRTSPERRAAFARAAIRARAALRTFELDEAARQLDAAESHVALPEQLAEVQALRAASEQLRLFGDALRSGLKKYQPGEAIRFGDVQAAISEVGDDYVVLFSERRKERYGLADMPRELLLLFAHAGADENDPDASGIYGAYYWTQGDLERARQMWQRAASVGIAVDELLPLAMPGAAAAARQGVPERAAIDAAAEQLQGRFSDAVVAANTAVRKAQLAARLLTVGKQSDDAAEQYAALEMARDLAVLGGDAETALAAVDELARWFDVDELEFKSQALGMALAGNVPPKTAGRIAISALELSAAAQAAGRGELAQSLADSAYAAARQSRDGDLVRRAYRWRSEVQGK